MAVKPSADSVIAHLARRQHGVVSRDQLLRLGLTRNQVTTRLQDGRLQILHTGVYLVGAVAPEHCHDQGALLACGAGSVLSALTAAHLWSLYRRRPGQPFVTIPADRRIARPGICVHRADLERRDIRRRYGLQLTSPPRAILECAAILGMSDDFELLVAEAFYRRLATESELNDQLARNHGRRGTAALRSTLCLPDGPQRTKSTGERAFLRILRREEIMGYEVNGNIHGHDLDFLWRDLSFAVELDGWDGHSSRVAFERDRLKVAEMKARGLDIMPVTGRQLAQDAAGVLARLNAALALARERRSERRI